MRRWSLRSATRGCRRSWGYTEFLTAIADPKHDDYEQMIERAGDDFDPERCDLVDINASLKPICS